MLLYFAAWTNNLSDFEDDGYSDVDEEESDEEFNQKSEGNNEYDEQMPSRVFSSCDIDLLNVCYRASKEGRARCF